MEFLRKSLVQVAQHLSGLTTSQRLAIGLCAVLVVLSMVWLLQWAARPEMVPVVDPRCPFRVDVRGRDPVGAARILRLCWRDSRLPAAGSLVHQRVAGVAGRVLVLMSVGPPSFHSVM